MKRSTQQFTQAGARRLWQAHCSHASAHGFGPGECHDICHDHTVITMVAN